MIVTAELAADLTEQRGMLAALAQHIRRQRAEEVLEGVGAEGEALRGGRVVIGDDCVVQ